MTLEDIGYKKISRRRFNMNEEILALIYPLSYGEEKTMEEIALCVKEIGGLQ